MGLKCRRQPARCPAKSLLGGPDQRTGRASLQLSAHDARLQGFHVDAHRLWHRELRSCGCHHFMWSPSRKAAQDVGRKLSRLRHRHSASRPTSHSTSHLPTRSSSDSTTESGTEFLSQLLSRPASHSVTDSQVLWLSQFPIQSISHSTGDS